LQVLLPHAGKSPTLAVLQLRLAEQKAVHVLLHELFWRKLIIILKLSLLLDVVGSIGGDVIFAEIDVAFAL
jgi:hypothetical protein